MKLLIATLAIAVLTAPAAAQAQKMCPDGTSVGGDRCVLAPDGSYVGGKPRLAPDGSYVGGRPKLTPNGRYIGTGDADEDKRATARPRLDEARTRLCPDGSYVYGTRCKLTPDGKYVGER